jgi:L-arabinose isomerase
MAGIEMLVIGADTDIRSFKQELRSNAVYYHLSKGI